MFNFFGFEIEQILCVGKAVASVRNCSDCWKSFLIVGKNISIKKSEKLIPDYKKIDCGKSDPKGNANNKI